MAPPTTRPYGIRNVVASARAKIAIIILCAIALLLVSQQLTTTSSGGILSLHPLQYAQCSAPHPDSPPEPASQSYRDRLNQIRPLDRTPHSKTLGVATRIYVLHLPARSDRRVAMTSLEQAMDLEFTWVNATELRSQTVVGLLERLRWWRSGHRVDNEGGAEAMADPSPFVFQWADDVEREDGEPLGVRGADLWSDTFGPGDDGTVLSPLPAPPQPDHRPPNLDSELEDGRTFGRLTILPAQVACWHSHYRLLRMVADAEGDDDEATIIFEDDIDMEWDLERRLRSVWEALPSDWDLLMMGHCLSHEWHYPPLDRAPSLHRAHNPLCTHAYAVTRRGARRISRYLRSEAFAYSRNIDIAYNRLLSTGRINAFSIYPPIVVQDQVTESDITPGRPQKLQPLADSALERIAMAKREDEEAAKAAEPIAVIQTVGLEDD